MKLYLMLVAVTLMSVVCSGASLNDPMVADLLEKVKALEEEVNAAPAAQASVGFSARLSVNTRLNTGPTPFENVLLNQANAYDGFTGTFTAPVASTYMFTVYGIATNSGGTDGPVLIVQNDNVICQTFVADSGAETGTCTAIVFLNVGDTVNVEGANTDVVLQANYSGFIGHIVSDA